MNPRILKKLSKRADPYIAQLMPHETRCLIEPGEDGESSAVVEKKYLERWNGKPNKHGYFNLLSGTVMYGRMEGYYEPEWQEDDAYSHLKRIIQGHFTDWDNWDGECYPLPFKTIKTPRDVFRYADEVLAASSQMGLVL